MTFVLRRALLASAAMGGEAYWSRIYNTERASLIGLWRQNETSGATAVDISPQANNGAYTGVDLANAAGPDGTYVPYYDGTNDYLNIYSAGLNTDFSGAAGTILAWAKVSGAGAWADGVARSIVWMEVDANNQIYIQKSAGNNRVNYKYGAAGTSNFYGVTSISPTGWVCYALTWSAAADKVIVYYNGVPQTTMATLGVWAGNLSATKCTVGSTYTTPGSVWAGWIGPVAIWSKALTAGQIAELSSI